MATDSEQEKVKKQAREQHAIRCVTLIPNHVPNEWGTFVLRAALLEVRTHFAEAFGVYVSTGIHRILSDQRTEAKTKLQSEFVVCS